MWIKRLNYYFDKIVLNLLIVVVIALLFFSCWSVVSRLMQVTNLWAEPLMRHLVFLSLFLGGTLAIHNDQHIRMDLVSRYLDLKSLKKTEALLLSFLYLLCVFFLVYLIKASYGYMLLESETPSEAFLGLDLHHMLFIIPFGLSIMSLRFMTQICDKLTFALTPPKRIKTNKRVIRE